MRNRKMFMCLLAILMVLSLCGCSLAVADAEEENYGTQDRLVGVFITTEQLDLFDMEGYLEENADELVNGSSIDVGETADYHGKLYASVDKHNSRDPFDWEISFEGMEGVCFFDAKWQNEGEEPFSMLSGGDEICDVTTHLTTTDKGEDVVLTGKMYVLRGTDMGNKSFYMNPVYQTQNGDIYVMGGDSGSMRGLEEGGSFSMSLSGSTTVSMGGEPEEYSTSVEVEFVNSKEPVWIRFHYMDENLNVFHMAEYAPGTLPETHTVSADISCVVVETEWENGETTRELYEPDGEEPVFIETFFKVSEIALGKQIMEMVWE